MGFVSSCSKTSSQEFKLWFDSRRLFEPSWSEKGGSEGMKEIYYNDGTEGVRLQDLDDLICQHNNSRKV